ncbi:MAG: transcription antitermination factor NusB [Lachnospiraceae bacterium]|nr:transcription antitermination factor NusB [Lachnospiraceae bacterium]
MVNEDNRAAEVEKLSQSAKREQVFISLFLSGFYEERDKSEALSNYYEMQDFSGELTEQIRSRYLGVKEHLGTIDTLLQQYAIGWDLNRMGKAEISILRLAVYEILYDETIPEKVAANEAVELAKKYGTKESYSFINGILGKVIASNHESGV